MIPFLVTLISATMKVTIGYITFIIATWFNLPEWGVIVLICMAVQSTHLTYKVI